MSVHTYEDFKHKDDIISQWGRDYSITSRAGIVYTLLMEVKIVMHLYKGQLAIYQTFKY